MPCISEYPEERDNRIAKEQKAMRDELDKVTRLLCEVSHHLTKNQLKNLSLEFMQWKTQHDAWDKKRRQEAQSRKRKEILGKKDKVKALEKQLKELKKEVREESKYTSFEEES